MHLGWVMDGEKVTTPNPPFGLHKNQVKTLMPVLTDGYYLG